MGKFKSLKAVEEQHYIDTFDYTFLVISSEDFKNTFVQVRNPLELMMATKLFIARIPFVYQKKIDINGESYGRKYVVADFVLPEYNIIIETDGKYHTEESQLKKDRSKDNFLVSLGYRIFRFDWETVMSDSADYDVMSFVIEAISNTLDKIDISNLLGKE